MQPSPSESNTNVCPLGNDEEESLHYSMVVFGSSLSNKTVNKGGLKRFFEAKWQNNAGVKVEDYNDGIFILTFDRQSVKSRVLRGQPWYFSNNYLVLIDSEGLNQITVENLKHVPIWIQVFGVPLPRINKSLGKGLPTKDFMEKGEQSEDKRVRGESKGDKEELKAKEFLLSEGDQGNEEMDFYSGIFQYGNEGSK
ncbi:hypothetical protein F8388_008916 [Cannabis sativa]|uniref:DUF4283 domain-containing protein n=2 Tax=Cannabis sativa TaxID=3483 RepID=A0A7J6H893_CANSA|nr:hypothetical protein G4B88_020277 [Cannabis sativa]KAF4391512.1 hypothetical protein F8388_008916 [Cannabis sativa]